VSELTTKTIAELRDGIGAGDFSRGRIRSHPKIRIQNRVQLGQPAGQRLALPPQGVQAMAALRGHGLQVADIAGHQARPRGTRRHQQNMRHLAPGGDRHYHFDVADREVVDRCLVEFHAHRVPEPQFDGLTFENPCRPVYRR